MPSGAPRDLLEHLLHLERKRALGGNARGGIGQARRNGNLLDLVAECLLHSAKEVLVLLGSVLGLLLLILGCQVKIAGSDVLELQVTILDLGLGTVGNGLLGSLASSIVLIDLGHIARHVLTHGLERELVHILRQQQHVIAAVEHALYHGHLGQALTRVAGGVVDGLLILGHALAYSARVIIFCSLADQNSNRSASSSAFMP